MDLDVRKQPVGTTVFGVSDLLHGSSSSCIGPSSVAARHIWLIHLFLG
jgi:hypothetical protein